MSGQRLCRAHENHGGVSRRSLLKGLAAAGSFAVLPELLTACGGSDSVGGGSATRLTMGSNHSDTDSRPAFSALMGAATKATGVKVKTNVTDHDTFQNNISNYLQGTPDDLFCWFAGYRMQYFAAQGLAEPIDDVWDKIGDNFGPAAKTLSKGADGHYYFVPLYTYPWVMFYNKSDFAKRGYDVPATWDELIALAKSMKSEGLTPLAFGNKDLWPSLGTFDILNMRINGYDYHMSLMRHETPWTDKGVTDVLDHWRELLPYVQEGGNGRAWEDAAKSLEHKQAGMMYQGTAQVAANYAPANVGDLDVFLFPEVNAEHGQLYIDSPTDGVMMAKKAQNKAAGRKVLGYLGTAEAEDKYLKSSAWQIGVAKDVSEAGYNTIQKKSVSMLARSKAQAQFLDTDTVPAMATAVAELFQKFIADPTSSSVKSLQSSAEAQAKGIFS
jgi:multiple sugar transport system substrate-binding protein